MSATKAGSKGFSLIELIIAIAILVILTGLLAPKMMRYLEKAREAKIIKSCDEFCNAFKVLWADSENVYLTQLKEQTQIYINYGAGSSVKPAEAAFEKYALEYLEESFGEEAKKYMGVIYLDPSGNPIVQMWKYLPDGIPADKKANATYYVYLTNPMYEDMEPFQGPFTDNKWSASLGWAP